MNAAEIDIMSKRAEISRMALATSCGMRMNTRTTADISAAADRSARILDTILNYCFLATNNCLHFSTALSGGTRKNFKIGLDIILIWG